MNGESQKPEGKNYVPAKPENLLAVFVEQWFGPKGRAGDGASWRFGMMCTVLSYLMSASQIPHKVIGGSISYKTSGENGGKEITEPHSWIHVEKDYFEEGEDSFEIYDPCRKLYPKDIKYTPEKVFDAVQFIPCIYQKQGQPLYEFFLSKEKDGSVELTLGVSDSLPGLIYKLPRNQAIELAERILFATGITSQLNPGSKDEND